MPSQTDDSMPNLPDLLAIDAEELADRMLEPATLRAIYEDAATRLCENRTAQGLYALVDSAIETMEDLWADLAQDEPDYACRKGCSWCCQQTVMVTAPEALLVAQYIRERYDAETVAKLRDRIVQNAEKIEGLSNDERLDNRLACVFLQEGECSIYPARPLPCRGGFSEDAEYCLNLLNNREETQAAVAAGTLDGKFLFVPNMLFDSAQVGMAAAVRNDVLNADPIELTAAVAIALSDPDIAD